MRKAMATSRWALGASPREGFTLIELLVVIAVIGILMAVLLPAIGMVVESTRRASCQNNLRQIGMAVIMFEQDNGHLPPATYGEPYAKFDTGLPMGGTAGSPFTKLLPYLEKKSVYDLYNWEEEWFSAGNQTAVNTQIETYLCPSSTGSRRQLGLAKEANRNDAPDRTAASTDYTAVYSFGYPMAVPNEPMMFDMWAVGALSPAPEESQGFFNIKYRFPRRRDTTDGDAKTLTFIERAAPTQRWIGKKLRDPNPVAARAWAPWAGRGCTWVLSYESGGESWAYTGIGPCNVNCNNHQGVYAFHPGGANSLFLDGSVHFLAEGLDGYVLHAFVSRSRKESVDAPD
jgi:prepilin-type N-terminal cleavage/methylation domain-containing protein/prepilin-type processing-associated H-X9-DG protein